MNIDIIYNSFNNKYTEYIERNNIKYYYGCCEPIYMVHGELAYIKYNDFLNTENKLLLIEKTLLNCNFKKVNNINIGDVIIIHQNNGKDVHMLICVEEFKLAHIMKNMKLKISKIDILKKYKYNIYRKG